MPKEYCHWVFAERVAALAPEKLKPIIEENKHFYYLGAVAPDTAYYYLSKHEKKAFARAANRVHGRYGKNTYSFIVKLYDYYKDNITSRVWAFILGVVTHICADATLHPVIFYFCGTPECGNPDIARFARIRHRVFESWLDLKYKREFSLLNNGKYLKSYNSLGKMKKDFISLLHVYLFQGTPVDMKEVKKTIWAHGCTQALFSNGIFYTLLSFLNFFSKGRYDDFIALSYFTESNHPFKGFEEEFTFRHPVTGKTQKTSMRSLENEAVAKAVTFFKELADVMGQRKIRTFLNTVIGPNLDTGLDSSGDTMHIFSLLPLTKL